MFTLIAPFVSVFPSFCFGTSIFFLLPKTPPKSYPCLHGVKLDAVIIIFYLNVEYPQRLSLQLSILNRPVHILVITGACP